MTPAARQNSIDELFDKANGSLTTGAWFEAERMGLKALLMARQLGDFERMTKMAVPLREARRQRLRVALDSKKVTVVNEPVTENLKLMPGCYLVEPPLVGADARRLRLAALQIEVPVAVLCREPTTKLKQWPIVAIGAGVTIRTRLDPPRNPSKPDISWFENTLELLGEWALQTIDPTLEASRRVDVILDRLDTVPDHDGLHALLEETCREAAEAGAAESSESATKTRSSQRTRLKS